MYLVDGIFSYLVQRSLISMLYLPSVHYARLHVCCSYYIFAVKNEIIIKETMGSCASNSNTITVGRVDKLKSKNKKIAGASSKGSSRKTPKWNNQMSVTSPKTDNGYGNILTEIKEESQEESGYRTHKCTPMMRLLTEYGSSAYSPLSIVPEGKRAVPKSGFSSATNSFNETPSQFTTARDSQRSKHLGSTFADQCVRVNLSRILSYDEPDFE